MSSAGLSFAPVAAPTGVPLQLAMQRLWLTGRVLSAGARLTVMHVFRSGENKPLEVVYSFPLPRDAALRSFRITGDGFEAHSELKPTEEAVKAYEQGIAAGSLSTLARQYGDGLINLTVGNIRPGETVTVYLDLLAGVEAHDGGFRFRFPFTLAPAYHSRMKAARVAAGEGEMELPANEFGDLILPRFREDAGSLHEVGFDLSVLHQLPVAEIGSPSHSIRVQQDGIAPVHVFLAPEKDVPNRDLVLDLAFKEAVPEVLAGEVDGKRTFAAIVPSTAFGKATEAPRRTVIVVDRSGSMQGEPIAQARKATEACLAVLADNDSFGLVAFDDRVESMSDSLLPGSRETREKARAFLAQVDARGGTELAKGFLEAARMLGGEGGDVLILTDGQVFGSEQILGQARAAHIRLFCLGIGSASQDRFLSLLARETGGVSRFVTARERVDLAAVDLFASMGRPVASGLKSTADVSPEPAAAVFAGTPVVLFGQAETDWIELTWDSGRLSLPVPSGDSDTGHTVRLLQGSRLITDFESRYASEEALAPIEKRKQSRIAARLAELSRTYGLASREMSLVAVVKRAGDRPGELPETRVVPVGMPQDTRFGAYFGAPQSGASAYMATAIMASALAAPSPMAAMPAASPRRAGSILARARFTLFGGESSRPTAPPPPSVEDELMELAAQLESDGGVPGHNASDRAARSVAAVLAFVEAGNTVSTGTFRSHVSRLVAFLKSMEGLSRDQQSAVERAIEAASTGRAPGHDWLALARPDRVKWSRIEARLNTTA